MLMNKQGRIFQSTPSARRATKRARHDRRLGIISIHALREESDGFFPVLLSGSDNFNPRPPRGERHENGLAVAVPVLISIHALREEGDLLLPLTAARSSIFQSTPSARRATPVCTLPSPPIPNFNPRPPRGGRLPSSETTSVEGNFNPRPPRGERPWVSTTTPTPPAFQSTPSARRAT